MLKMFHASAVGSSSAFCEDRWVSFGEESAEDVERMCRGQAALLQMFSRIVQPDRWFLEGGCGPGHWVRYFHRRGHKVLGVDFASQTLARVRRHVPGAPLLVGDVTRMPIADGSVHTYYSGGVAITTRGGSGGSMGLG